ncbi:hypothetical protein SEA_PUPPER_196 [Gordonia phage Pupper]|uniref:Uncharacterized protein n=1 Tax=Gordonia phage Pupper TaxID=2571249 RepID=A0A4Y6EJN5_9CAUD|nr:hypothetical protein KHQ83_gp081 [Gordonia phage Pupper]QDF18682.1 hypothetical protein SEA_PUPPER_196 [Gordonia phage Pupper]QDF18914.1 hypothetical protein SEA_SCENTAE_195 [Gordonia phage SCentae]
MAPTIVTPANPSELRRALVIKRPGLQRTVIVHSWACSSRRSTDHDFTVHVVPGASLDIIVRSGLPFLKLLHGEVTVTFQSSWGNSLELGYGTRATVKVNNPNVKVTLTGDRRGLTLLASKDENRENRVRDFTKNPQRA